MSAIFHSKQLLFALLCSITVILIADRAGAQAALSEAELVEFDITAQAVPGALSEFARQARAQFLFNTEGFEDVEANAVVGSYPIQEALNLLLTGTGLSGIYSADAIIRIRRVMAPVSGQLADATETAPDAGPVIEEVLITGSRIRGVASMSPVVAITRQDIENGGFATVEEVIGRLPQNFGGGASLDTLTDTGNDTHVVGGNVGNEAGGTSINLRGLGTNSTLILLNGRRLSPSGFSAAFTNVSSIPITAIERVEVMADGASAIYGSDAIGGVVNFILRDEYEGAETRLRYGSDGPGDMSSALFGQLFGRSWNDGNILFTYEYYESDSLANSDRDFTSSNDLRRFGGSDLRELGGNPANISAGGRLWAIPGGQDGRSLTPADFPTDASGAPTASPNRFNDRSLGDVLPAVERQSAVLHLKQRVNAAEWFLDARFSTQETRWRRNLSLVDIEVTDANPFFVDPTGTGLTAVTVTNYSLDNELGPQINTGKIDSPGAVFGLRFDLGESWDAEFSVNWAKEGQKTISNLGINVDVLNAAANPAGPNPGPNQAFNPFGDGVNSHPDVVAALTSGAPVRLTDTDNEIRSLNLDINGTGFELPGGAIQFAFGSEFREESLLTTSNFDGTGDITSSSDRNITSLYAEAFFPLLSRRRLALSLAGRYEDYSDVGDDVDPKVGLLWSPLQSLTFRATYGTSFRAPSLLNLDVDRRSTNLSVYFSQSLVDEGLVPFPMIARVGNNAELQPEQASTWTVGLQWRPERVEGLSLDLNYFNIDLEDRIELPITSLETADDPRFASLVNYTPSLQQIAALVNDPRWLNASGASEADILSGAVPVAIVDSRLSNISRSVVTGLELLFTYGRETALGSFGVGFTGSYMIDFERAFFDTDALLDEVDTYGRPVDFRARGSVNWSRNAWSVSGIVNYTDSYTDSISLPARRVDSWTVADISVVYTVGDSADFLQNTRLMLTAHNLFDARPPFVNTPAGLAYDSYNADPHGRFLAAQIIKEW